MAAAFAPPAALHAEAPPVRVKLELDERLGGSKLWFLIPPPLSFIRDLEEYLVASTVLGPLNNTGKRKRKVARTALALVLDGFELPSSEVRYSLI
jgi:hypothetical protein